MLSPQLMSLTDELASSSATADREKSLLRQQLSSTVAEEEYEKLRMNLLQAEQRNKKTQEEMEKQVTEKENIFKRE